MEPEECAVIRNALAYKKNKAKAYICMYLL